MNRYHRLTKPNVAKQNANFAEAVKLMLWEFHIRVIQQTHGTWD